MFIVNDEESAVVNNTIPAETLEWMNTVGIRPIDPKFKYIAFTGMLYSEEYLAKTPLAELKRKYDIFAGGNYVSFEES